MYERDVWSQAFTESTFLKIDLDPFNIKFTAHDVHPQKILIIFNC